MMAEYSLQQLYLGDKYNLMGEVMKEFLSKPLLDENPQTGLELLIVKHTLLVAEKLKENGDYVLDLKSET